MAESEEELESLLMKVKEESEKVGLKLNIQKTKIMASGPITSWQVDGETVETGRPGVLQSKSRTRLNSWTALSRGLLLWPTYVKWHASLWEVPTPSPLHFSLQHYCLLLHLLYSHICLLSGFPCWNLSTLRAGIDPFIHCFTPSISKGVRYIKNTH